MATKENEKDFLRELNEKFKKEWEKKLGTPDGDKRDKTEEVKKD